SAKRVLNRLTEQPTEGVAKEFVGDDVAELHRSAFHGINEANPVDEITFAGSEHFVKLLQLFRWHGEIRVENHQNVAVSLGKSFTHCVSFPAAGLLKSANIELWILRLHAQNLRPGPVRGVTFHENEFPFAGKPPDPFYGRLNVALFIAGWNENGDCFQPFGDVKRRPADHESS